MYSRKLRPQNAFGIKVPRERRRGNSEPEKTGEVYSRRRAGMRDDICTRRHKDFRTAAKTARVSTSRSALTAIIASMRHDSVIPSFTWEGLSGIPEGAESFYSEGVSA